ncbi:alpha/beta hydrolase-fold protein [Micromonospora carbonacea]|uniref:Acyl-CoA:diacylglycerol acyltransferase n=1 Tax=Micromonospora carbonacea TaxID=47853 RepID=A0A7H8XR60_9ACTN|nr:alpha/beta hydrolase-fold protein [Micromonospora carbonacea]MBB5824622.1 S-formylglutathione hydrolase FrmB [Micromonospora carbonacea]QLD27200.1 esterase [Micromonospora carbonacea]
MVARLSRRGVLVAASGAAVLAVGGAVAARELIRPRPGPAPALPDAPAGDERLLRRESAARGRTVDFWTAVPAGHGDGRGLPVCLVLHGASATPRDYARFGLARFLTDAVRGGAPPFVLAGATGGRLSWRPSGADDPQRMVREEVPAWCAERGFDVARVAAWGWSMGGFGSLLLAETFPGWLRAVAAFSPAVHAGDAVFTGAARLRGTPVGLWCGRQDGLLDDVQALARALPEPPVREGYADGRHDFTYWGRVVPDAFALLGAALARP